MATATMIAVTHRRRSITGTLLLLLCSHVLFSLESVTNAWTATTRTKTRNVLHPPPRGCSSARSAHGHHDDRPSSSTLPPPLHEATRIRERPDVSINLLGVKYSSSSSSSVLPMRRSKTTRPYLLSPSSPRQRLGNDESTVSSSSSSFAHDCPGATSSRRNVLLQASSWAGLVAAVQLTTQSPEPAAAAATAAAAGVVTTPATCDATVSVWRKDRRIVYLLGTAHISAISAELAGRLVQEAHPQAVFVELDLKRVGGLLLSSSNRDNGAGGGALEYVPQGMLAGGDDDAGATAAARLPPPRILVPVSSSAPSTRLALSTSDAAVSSSTNADLMPPEQQPGDQTSSSSSSSSSSWFQRQLLSVAAATVGRALKSMYETLGESGFKPGDEFRTAMQMAQQQGATIVLGDQDVQITLRRLTQALKATDWQKLQSPDVERKLNALMPTTTNGGIAAQALPPARENYTTNEAFKKDLSEYVENLKSRESVRNIMSQLQEIAPALVQVMLTERDAYMARGLDAINEFDVTVAVMGIAHQDGVERNLQNFGWQNVRLNCSGIAKFSMLSADGTGNGL